jgi:hypothetical protein
MYEWEAAAEKKQLCSELRRCRNIEQNDTQHKSTQAVYQLSVKKDSLGANVIKLFTAVSYDSS